MNRTLLRYDPAVRATLPSLVLALAITCFMMVQTAPPSDDAVARFLVGTILLCAILVGGLTSFVAITLSRRASEFELALPVTSAQILRTRITAQLFLGLVLACVPAIDSLPVGRRRVFHHLLGPVFAVLAGSLFLGALIVLLLPPAWQRTPASFYPAALLLALVFSRIQHRWLFPLVRVRSARVGIARVGVFCAVIVFLGLLRWDRFLFDGVERAFDRAAHLLPLWTTWTLCAVAAVLLYRDARRRFERMETPPPAPPGFTMRTP